MAEMNLLKGDVMDILYLQHLKNTTEMGSQLNKYWHGALTSQPQRVFLPLCVYFICNFIYFWLFVKSY
jgi:hypothetical protein